MKVSREDMNLDTDCKIRYQTKGGRIQNCTANIRAQNSDWLLLKNSRAASILKKIIISIEEA